LFNFPLPLVLLLLLLSLLLSCPLPLVLCPFPGRAPCKRSSEHNLSTIVFKSSFDLGVSLEVLIWG
jgi:hypothetical protein